MAKDDLPQSGVEEDDHKHKDKRHKKSSKHESSKTSKKVRGAWHTSVLPPSCFAEQA